MVAAARKTRTQTRTQTRWLDELQRVLRFDETGSDGFHRSWIMLFPEGEYEHPQYGELHFTAQRLSEIKRLFDERVRHIDIALDANHDQDKATGWLERLDLRPATGAGTPAGLWGLVRWTPYGMRLLKDQLYRYFSPEFGPWTDPASGRKYANVLIGGGLTNRPFLKEMPAVQLSGDGGQISHRSWASVNKSMLPRSAFLDPGDPDKKSTWRLPVYEGAGPKDADGCYTQRGPLNINGVRAALAALGGAHTGRAMTGVPSGVRAKLEGWLKRYGGEKSQQKSQQASESAGGGVEESRMARNQRQQATDPEFDEETQSFADDTSDDEEMAEDDEESESYDEADGDGGDEGGDDGDENAPVDAKSDTHGAFSGRHSHGKFGMHAHDGEGDHSDAQLKAARGGKKMSESPRTAAQLREAYDTQAQQLAEMREQLYRRDVADTLKGWDEGKFQFTDAPRPEKGAPLPLVALSKRFRDQYSAFMLHEAAELPLATRKKLNALLETSLSAAIVDLSKKGASFDQEKRRTLSGGKAGVLARQLEGGDVVEQAQRLAEARGKKLAELSYGEQLALMNEASEEQSGASPF